MSIKPNLKYSIIHKITCYHIYSFYIILYTTIHLRDKHFIRKGDIKAPMAAPIEIDPIKIP